jgi:hypothetical protein
MRLNRLHEEAGLCFKAARRPYNHIMNPDS